MTTIQIFWFLIACMTGVYGECFKEKDFDPKRLPTEDFFDASTRFSIRLLQALDTNRDVFFSPFSVWSSLLLLYLGARGPSERQLEVALGVRGMGKGALAGRLRAARLPISMMNSVFLQEGAEVPGCLLPFDLSFVDFQREPELARAAINLLVQARTGGRIREILPPGSVHGGTRWAAASTAHFARAWLQPFTAQATHRAPFFASLADAALVDMMATRDTFPFAESEELQCAALELPYAGRALSMLLLLPHNRAHGVQILQRSLTAARLRNLTEELWPREALLVLPRFQLEHSLPLGSALRRLGLREADLGGALFHKARVSVDERGTEAAAATVGAFARQARPSRTVQFVVDRPFVFLIRENRYNSIFFIGVVRHPEYDSSIT